MYVPSKYATPPQGYGIRWLIESYPFGFVMAPTSCMGAHVPILLNDTDPEARTLSFHLARANPLCSSLAQNPQGFVSINGPHALIRSDWYAHPERTPPTWNYVVAHGLGTASVGTDMESVRENLKETLSTFQPGAATIDMDADSTYLHNLMAAVTVVTFTVERWTVKWKLGQNRSQEDRRRVIDALRTRGGDDDLAIATLMEHGLRERSAAAE